MVRRVVAGVLGVLVGGVAGLSPAGAVERGQWWHGVWEMPRVWQVADGAGVTVAVIDSGVDASISELDGAVVPGVDILAEDGGDGMVDGDPDGSHGTEVATLIAGHGGASGFAGVAVGSTILPIAVIAAREQRESAYDYLSEGIRYAVDRGAHVINISLGGASFRGECPRRVAAAVRYAVSQDAVVVTPAGNTPDGETEYPANCPGAVTAGGLDPELEVWESSHRSPHVDVAAPGAGLSAVGRAGEVRYLQGTSYASALVSGVVALVRSQFPDASAYEVVARLLATAEDHGTAGRNDATGYGMVRPYEALTAEVPADAPNPVYDGLDLDDIADPGSLRDGFDAPPRPERSPVAAPPSAGGGVHIGAVVFAVGVLVVVVIGVPVAIILRSRRRRVPAPSVDW